MISAPGRHQQAGPWQWSGTRGSEEGTRMLRLASPSPSHSARITRALIPPAWLSGEWTEVTLVPYLVPY